MANNTDISLLTVTSWLLEAGVRAAQVLNDIIYVVDDEVVCHAWRFWKTEYEPHQRRLGVALCRSRWEALAMALDTTGDDTESTPLEPPLAFAERYDVRVVPNSAVPRGAETIIYTRYTS